MYCFQDGSEVIGIKREVTDTLQEQQKSALAVTFPETKAVKEVRCISFISIVIQNFKHLALSEHFMFCVIHITVHNTYI
jgi:hypothetical protein